MNEWDEDRKMCVFGFTYMRQMKDILKIFKKIMSFIKSILIES